MATYYLTGNIKHDGREYKRGDRIDLSDLAAPALIEMGVVQAEPVGEAEPQEEPQQRPEEGVSVGGAPVETGEPSIDGDQTTPRTEAKDITPSLEEMKRPELEAFAVSRGIAEEDAKAAPNKAALVDMLSAKDAPKAPEEQTHDPSANL